MKAIKNIFVAVDFDAKTKILLDQAVQLAQKFNSKVWIVHIAAPEPSFVGYEAGPQYIRDDRASSLRKEHKLLGGYAEKLKKAGIKAQSLLVQGPTVEMILKETVKLKIDLIIMGHHEHSFLYKTFFGSSALAVIKKARIPLLVVPLK